MTITAPKTEPTPAENITTMYGPVDCWSTSENRGYQITAVKRGPVDSVLILHYHWINTGLNARWTVGTRQIIEVVIAGQSGWLSTQRDEPGL